MAEERDMGLDFANPNLLVLVDMEVTPVDMEVALVDMEVAPVDMEVAPVDMEVIPVDMEDVPVDMEVIVSICGDLFVTGNEVCDDGNTEDEDYCSADCSTVTGHCGDGVVQLNEDCDPEQENASPLCTAACEIGVGCGNSIREGDEACDGEVWCSTDCEDTRPCATSICPNLEFTPIQGGTFTQGRRPGPASGHISVTTGDFYIQTNEVTVAEYRSCVEAEACTVPTARVNRYCYSECPEDQSPINGVTWYQADDFARWVGGVLPTEAAWEFAAQSEGTRYPYPWGDTEISCERAVYEDRCQSDDPRWLPVCSKMLGHTEQGVCDMIGGIHEWVQDHWHETLVGAPNDGTAWIDADAPASARRVFKGGAYNTPSEDNLLRIWGRAPLNGLSSDRLIGFRVMIPIP